MRLRSPESIVGVASVAENDLNAGEVAAVLVAIKYSDLLL
jgi:hypothetical protein